MPHIKLLCAKEYFEKLMRFHDYHLQKYEVSDYGKTIKLFLSFGYPGEETDFSQITFENVALYNFVHSAYSIITDIEKVRVATLLREQQSFIETSERLYSLECWKGAIDSTADFLEQQGFNAWRVQSAIGFYGFIVAKSVTGT